MKASPLFLLKAMLAAGLVGLGIPLAQAASCDEIRQTARGLEGINNLFTKQCIAEQNDNHSLTQDILAIKEAYPKDGKIIPDQRRRSVLTLLDKLQKNLPTDLKDLPPTTREAIAKKIDDAIAAAKQDRLPTPELNVDNWTYIQADGALGAKDREDKYPPYSYLYIDVRKDVLEPACNTPASTACAKATTAAESLLRYAGLMIQIGQFSAQDLLIQLRDQARLVDDQWKLYIQKARSQHILELIVNSCAFERKGDTLLLPPPDYQWIVAHPSVAMEYVAKASDGSRFEPALLVEWIGYNRWNWKPGQVAAMGTAWGGSLISTFSDRAGTRSTGHGVMLHYDHVYSLGVTRHGSDTGFFISIDLQKLFMDKQKQFEEVTDRFSLSR